MQFSKEQTDPCTITLDITIDADTVSQGFDRAYKEFGKYTAVPGFRPGKAPRIMVERYVNKEKLLQRVMELVAGPAYREILDSEKITPYVEPEVDFADLVDKQEWQFKAIVQTPPVVKLGDLKGIKAERPLYTVTDADVEQQLVGIQNEYARTEKIDGRGVEAADVVIAELEAVTEGDEPPAEPRRRILRMGENIPGFDEKVVGMKIDDEKEFDLAYPDDHQDPDRAGKNAHYKVKIVSINKRILPEVTDEWVKTITAFDTVDKLKAAIREHHENGVKDMADRIVETKIIEEIIERSDLAFPRVLVDQEMQEELHQLSHQLEQKNQNYEQYLEEAGLSEVEHQAHIASNATERVRGLLILRELAQKESIEVTGEEMAEEFGRLSMENNWTEEDARKIVQDERRRTQVANIVIRRKLRVKLFEMAEIKEVAAK
ncbi:MAG: trigger factor [Chthonomonadales bacterium]